MEQVSEIILGFRAADPASDVPYIRRCGQNAWYAVYGRLDDFSPESFWEHTAAILRARHDNIQIMTDGGVNAGVLVIDFCPPEEPDVAHISLLYLEPDYRGLGLGVQALDRVVELAAARGLYTVRLYVASTNERALKLYTNYGFIRARSPLGALSRQYTLRYRLKHPSDGSAPALK